jgi:Putative metal-binding motif
MHMDDNSRRAAWEPKRNPRTAPGTWKEPHMTMKNSYLSGALLGLALAACGPVDQVEPEAMELDVQALASNCTSVDDTLMTDHACAHANNPGDNVAVTASATRSAATAPDVSTKHKHYTVSLPVGAEGSVKLTPVATAAGDTVESMALYVSQNVSVTVVDSGGNTVAPALSEPLTSGCSLQKAVVYDLNVGTTYVLALGPATGHQVGLAPEYLDDNRVRWYVDGDGDTYGANTGFILTACEPPAGYVDRRFDCNDGNASINPGATEICGNPVDENCDRVTC